MYGKSRTNICRSEGVNNVGDIKTVRLISYFIAEEEQQHICLKQNLNDPLRRQNNMLKDGQVEVGLLNSSQTHVDISQDSSVSFGNGKEPFFPRDFKVTLLSFFFFQSHRKDRTDVERHSFTKRKYNPREYFILTRCARAFKHPLLLSLGKKGKSTNDERFH